ncbi:hypothetical protein Tco_1286359, partial [Tanacetum coccineum]
AGRQTGPAPVYAGTPVPTGRQNRPAPFHADRPFPAGRRNSVSMYMGEGRWGTAVKSSTGCSWRDSRPYLQRGSKNNGGPHWDAQSIMSFLVLQEFLLVALLVPTGRTIPTGLVSFLKS